MQCMCKVMVGTNRFFGNALQTRHGGHIRTCTLKEGKIFIILFSLTTMTVNSYTTTIRVGTLDFTPILIKSRLENWFRLGTLLMSR